MAGVGGADVVGSGGGVLSTDGGQFGTEGGGAPPVVS